MHTLPDSFLERKLNFLLSSYLLKCGNPEYLLSHSGRFIMFHWLKKFVFSINHAVQISHLFLVTEENQ